jgi:hypothetical protein
MFRIYESIFRRLAPSYVFGETVDGAKTFNIYFYKKAKPTFGEVGFAFFRFRGTKPQRFKGESFIFKPLS